MNTFRDNLKRWGLLRTLHIVLMSTLSPWLTVTLIFVRPLGATASEANLPKGITSIRIATREDLDLAIKEIPDYLSSGFVRDALDRGDFCVAAFAGDHMASFVRRSFTTTRHTGDIWVAFEKPFRYGYNAYTQPKYRGRHLQHPVTIFTDKLCIDRGFTHTIGFIRSDNYSSILAERRREGCELKGYAGYLKLFNRYFFFRSPGAKKCTFRFYQRGFAEESQGNFE